MALTSSDLDAIDAAIASGELSVRDKDGRQITYRSMGELLQARDAIKAEVASTSSTARPYPRHQMADFSD